MIREARPVDLEPLIELLSAEGMRTEAVPAPGAQYFIAEHEGRVAGGLGLEIGATCVLLRSAVVAPDLRGRGIGKQLTEAAIDWARSRGYPRVYCFSTDAWSYWLLRGFEECTVEEVVRAMPEAPQVLLFRDLGWLPTERAFRLNLA